MYTKVEQAKASLELIRVGKIMENKANADGNRKDLNLAIATQDRGSEILTDIYTAMIPDELEEISIWYRENEDRIFASYPEVV